MSGIGHNQPAYVSVNSLSDADKKKLKNAVLEMNDSMTRVSAERDLQKEIIGKMAEDLGVDKKLFRRMSKVYYKANYSQEQEDNRNFEEMYDEVMK